METMPKLMLKRERIAACVLTLIVLAVVTSLRKEYSRISWGVFVPDTPWGKDEKSAQPYPEKSQNSQTVNLTARFQERYRRMREVCQRERDKALVAIPPNAKGPRLLFPTKGTPTVLYCPVARVGTTLLRRVIAAANNMDPARTNWKERFHVREVPEGYDKAILFFFAREPYSRLLSSYVSKLWLPNPEYWSAVGGPVVATVRDDPSMAELACGSDVTFAELIRYVILSMEIERRIANYFTPSHQLCQVCKYDYDYIGHMETFSEDATHILSTINLTIAPQYDDMHDDEYDIINNYVYSAYFTLTNDKGRCISKYKIFLRTWRALQMRGLISTRLPFPLKWEHTHDLKRMSLRNLALEAHNKTKEIFRVEDQQTDQSASAEAGSRERTSAQVMQRKMALASAWSTVPMEDRVRIRELFKLELDLFGYDPFLEEVFSPKVKVDKEIFDLNSI